MVYSLPDRDERIVDRIVHNSLDHAFHVRVIVFIDATLLLEVPVKPVHNILAFREDLPQKILALRRPVGWELTLIFGFDEIKEWNEVRVSSEVHFVLECIGKVTHISVISALGQKRLVRKVGMFSFIPYGNVSFGGNVHEFFFRFDIVNSEDPPSRILIRGINPVDFKLVI